MKKKYSWKPYNSFENFEFFLGNILSVNRGIRMEKQGQQLKCKSLLQRCEAQSSFQYSVVMNVQA